MVFAMLCYNHNTLEDQFLQGGWACWAEGHYWIALGQAGIAFGLFSPIWVYSWTRFGCVRVAFRLFLLMLGPRARPLDLDLAAQA